MIYDATISFSVTVYFDATRTWGSHYFLTSAPLGFYEVTLPLFPPPLQREGELVMLEGLLPSITPYNYIWRLRLSLTHF